MKMLEFTSSTLNGSVFLVKRSDPFAKNPKIITTIEISKDSTLIKSYDRFKVDSIERLPAAVIMHNEQELPLLVTTSQGIIDMGVISYPCSSV
jgi:hypothetical protein